MDIFKELAKPFDASKIHWRVGARNREKTKGIALAYIDARDVMDRLDAVLGPDNWEDRYHLQGKTMVCELTIRIGDRAITKSDGAGATDVEEEKGQISDAFKRAGVKFGVARYLYGLPNVWVPLKNEKYIESPPPLPAWALPKTPTVAQVVKALKEASTGELLDEKYNKAQAYPHLKNNDEIEEAYREMCGLEALKEKP